MDRLGRRHAELHHQLELVRVAAVLADPGVGAEGDLDALRPGLLQRLAGDADAPLHLRQHVGRVGLRVLLQALDVAVHGAQRRHVVGAGLAEQLDDLVGEHGAVLDRVGAGEQRGAHAVGAMRVHRDLLVVEPGRLDDGLRLVVEHLLAEPRPDAAVHAAGGGDLDQVDAACDLQPYRLAAGVLAVAEVLVIVEGIAQVVAEPQRTVHVAGGRRNGPPGVQDVGSDDLARLDGIAQRQRGPVTVAEVAHRGEAGVQRLLRVDQRVVGLGGGRQRHLLELRRDAARVRGQVNVAVDEPGQHEPRAQVEDPGLGDAELGGSEVPVPDLGDMAVPDQQCAGTARRLPRPVEQPARVHDHVGGWGGLRCSRPGDEVRQRGGEGGEREAHGRAPVRGSRDVNEAERQVKPWPGQRAFSRLGVASSP